MLSHTAIITSWFNQVTFQLEHRMAEAASTHPLQKQRYVLVPLHIQNRRENKLSVLLMLRVIKKQRWWSQILDMCITFLKCFGL